MVLILLLYYFLSVYFSIISFLRHGASCVGFGNDDSGSDDNGSDDNGSDDNGSDDDGSDDDGSDDDGSDDNAGDDSVDDNPGASTRNRGGRTCAAGTNCAKG